MILTTSLERDQRGNIKAQKSAYDPPEKVKTLTQQVLADFQLGHETMHRPFREFNDMSVLQRQALDQKAFNTWVEPKSDDPDEAWKSNAKRPIVRNKVISIAAHVTGSLIYPQIQAQNENDEEDRDAATVMRDLMEWSADTSNGGSGYEKTFLYAVIAALVNPAVIVHTEYARTHRTVKEVRESGKWEEKEVLDEALSGFLDSLVPVDELFIADPYQEDIQRQPWLVRRQVIDFAEAEQLYGDHDSFAKYVRPGVQVMLDEGTGAFYDQADEALGQRQVERVMYWNRSRDLQLCFLNGVLVTDPDQPNPRRDKRYPFAKGGYEPVDEGKFFYYKGLVSKALPDADVVDTLYRMIIDGSFLRLMPPTAVYGDEEIRSSVVTPGTVTVLGRESRLERIDVGSDLNAGFATLDRVENSISESSAGPIQSGQRGSGEAPTAFQISREEQNARIMLGLFGKMVGFLVRQFGDLRVSDIIQHLTVGDIGEIAGRHGQMKFRSFLIPDRTVDGRSKSRRIEFDGYMGDGPVSEGQMLDSSFGMLEEEGGMDSGTEIYRVNPRIFRRRRFLTKVTPDMVTPPSDNIRKALLLEEYDRAVANPLANQEAVFRDLLLGAFDATRHDTDKYVMRPEQAAQPQLAGALGAEGGIAGKLAAPGRPGGNNDLMQKVA